MPPILEPGLTSPDAQSAPAALAGESPRRALAVVLAGATVAAGLVAWVVADRLGADAHTSRRVLEATAIGIPATFAPVVLRLGRDSWALAVVGAGMARMMLSLGYCFALRELDPGILARPLFLAVASGAALLLVVEVGATVRMLSRLERGRGAPMSNSASRNPA